MPGRRLFNINFNIGGNARTSVVTARAVNSASSRAEGSRSRAALRLLTPASRFRYAHTARSAVHILSGGGMVEGVERSALDLGAAAGPWRVGGGWAASSSSSACAPLADVLQRMKMFDGMLNLTFLLLSLI